MTTTYRMQLRRAEGALVRMLGLVGRRGFETLEVHATTSACGGFVEVTLTVSGERPSDILARQLARLHEVERVAFVDDEARTVIAA